MSFYPNEKSIRHQVSMYVDGELSKAEQEALEIKAAADPKVDRMVQGQKSFKAFIKNNLRCTTPSERLSQEVLNRFRG
jgi:anti-sigma factor RsiW